MACFGNSVTGRVVGNEDNKRYKSTLTKEATAGENGRKY